MSYWGQPWGRVTLAGKPCRLQVLDPESAFTLEPEIIDRVGETLLMGLASPPDMTAAIVGDGAPGASIEETARARAAVLTRIGQLVANVLTHANLDGAWVAGVFESTIFDRLTIAGVTIDSWDDWRSSGMPWHARWRVLGAQLAQTYSPLWTRAPYNAGKRKANDYGVPSPGASITKQWAASLASQGYASGMMVILQSWTPGDLIDAVEVAAQRAEQSARASDAAKKGGP